MDQDQSVLVRVLEERLDGFREKIESEVRRLCDAVERNNQDHWKAIARLDRDIVTLKVKVYGLFASFSIIGLIIAAVKVFK